jgi:hypothetical protein
MTIAAGKLARRFFAAPNRIAWRIVPVENGQRISKWLPFIESSSRVKPDELEMNPVVHFVTR